MYNKITLTLIVAMLPVFLIAQDDGILPNQVTNIKRLAYRNGFNENTLAAYVHQVYGESIGDLSQVEGANLIRSFFSDDKPKPLTPDVTGSGMWTPVKEFLSERKDSDVKPVSREIEVSPEPIAEPDPEPEIAPIIASILEVGMEKRFHLLDGNIIQGTIIKTVSGKDITKIGREAPDYILVCEAAKIDYLTYLRLRARLAEKKGYLLMTGTFEGCLTGETLIATNEGILT